MAEYLTERIVDLAQPFATVPTTAQFALGDNNAYTFTALVCNSREPDAGLMAGTVSGAAMRPDGVTVALNGVKGAETREVIVNGHGVCNATPCSVTLPQACFAYPGRVLISIKLTDGTTATTVLAITGTVIRTETDAAVDPGEILPDLAELQAAAAEALDAADDAREAADEAAATVSAVINAEIPSIRSALSDTPIWSYASDTSITTKGGTNYHVYVFQQIIPAGAAISELSVRVYANCSFYYGLIAKNTGTVLWSNTATLTAGINSLPVAYIPTVDALLIIDQGPNKLLYKASGSIEYKMGYSSNSAYPNVGDTLTISSGGKASFAINLTLYINSVELKGLADDTAEDLAALHGWIEASQSSLPFEYDASASTVGPFLLLQPAPVDGTIYKLHFSSGSSSNGVDVHVFDWDGTLDRSHFIIKSTTVVAVADGVADCSIPIEQGQYIGIGSGASTSDDVVKWRNVSGGAGFVYLATNASITKYEGIYITLSYDMRPADSMPSYVQDIMAEAGVSQHEIYPLMGKTVFLAGDSRSSTDYSFYKGTLSEKAKCVALNLGKSGWTTAQIASNSYFAIVAANPHDFSIWLVGGNDSGEEGTIGTFSASSPLAEMGESVVTETDITADYAGSTFIQAVDHIMRKYKALYYDFKTLNNGHIPRMIFCTDLPQKRANPYQAFSDPENWERKRQAILECCHKNNVICLDLFTLCHFDMSYEPSWTSPTDKVHDNGLYFMDGLHPNKYGVDIITSLEYEELRRYIMTHTWPES